MSQCVTLLRTPGEAECLIPNPPLPWPQIIREYNSRCLFLPSLFSFLPFLLLSVLLLIKSARLDAAAPRFGHS